MTVRRSWFFPLLLLALLPYAPAAAQMPPSESVEFFEKRVRPVLADNCVSCHSGAQAAGGFRLDRLDGLRKAGARGVPAVVPGKPDASLLVRAVRHADPSLKMPPSGKLPAAQITAIEEWVRQGGAVPAPAPPTAGKHEDGFPLAARRRHWAYRPVARPAVPKVKNTAAVRNPVDAFLQARREKAGLKPAPPADGRTLLRRVTFDLTGLPPTPEETRAFLSDTRPDAYERAVERLLASPAYGERWARHWLDLVRYGESLGHEFDFDIPNAWRYRDYVVRAFNADVPYDRFVREHVAGDLMAAPRRDRETGRNESLIGTGFWWLGEGKHSPVDVRQEQADRIDNQIDVFGKAFLAQTLACARCHDHKFDPVPTKDYYALYGILKSSRYLQAHADAPETFARPARAAAEVQASVARAPVAAAWRAALAAVPDAALRAAVAPLGTGAEGRALPAPATWAGSGAAFAETGAPGEPVLSSDPARPVLGVVPRAGIAHSALRARRLEGSLRSPSFTIDRDFLHLKVSGQKGRVHVVVDNFVVIRDPIYGPLAHTVDDVRPRWLSIDLRLWKGRQAYVELQDGPLTCLSQAPLAPPDKPFDGWVRLDDARLSEDAKPPREANALAAKPPADLRAALDRALAAWGAGQPVDADALDALDRLVRVGDLGNAPPELAPAARRLAEVEATVPVPTRVAAICDGPAGEDERVFVRGSHQTLGERAPRLALAFCGREADPPASGPALGGSGRRELAAWVGSARHPLTARVMVNRLWKHHFGVGIVPSADDFGHMGERPSHPDLLDWLASEFARRGWSVKAMHRLMVLSNAYRMSSAAADAKAAAKDPGNALIHRMNVRRLEAEAIRDSLLAVSGRLDRTPYGPSVSVHLTDFTEGRGRPAQGPLDGDGRRSLYVAVRRNFLSPWMQAFDFPTPFTCMGRRSVSNVPAQALAMMNGPFVRQQADVWAVRLLKETPADTPAARRVDRLYEQAFARPPTSAERTAALGFLGPEPGADNWGDLCHVLFNVKEFIFVR